MIDSRIDSVTSKPWEIDKSNSEPPEQLALSAGSHFIQRQIHYHVTAAGISLSNSLVQSNSNNNGNSKMYILFTIQYPVMIDDILHQELGDRVMNRISNETWELLLTIPSNEDIYGLHYFYDIRKVSETSTSAPIQISGYDYWNGSRSPSRPIAGSGGGGSGGGGVESPKAESLSSHVYGLNLSPQVTHNNCTQSREIKFRFLPHGGTLIEVRDRWVSGRNPEDSYFNNSTFFESIYQKPGHTDSSPGLPPLQSPSQSSPYCYTPQILEKSSFLGLDHLRRADDLVTSRSTQPIYGQRRSLNRQSRPQRRVPRAIEGVARKVRPRVAEHGMIEILRVDDARSIAAFVATAPSSCAV